VLLVVELKLLDTLLSASYSIPPNEGCHKRTTPLYRYAIHIEVEKNMNDEGCWKKRQVKGEENMKNMV